MAKPNITVMNIQVAFDYEWEEGGLHHGYAQVAGIPNFSIPIERLPENLQGALKRVCESAARMEAAKRRKKASHD